MRPLGFMVADKNMEASLLGLFGRDDWHRSMDCAPVDVVQDDVHVASGQADCGLYTRGNELLRPLAGQYEHMVIMVDAEWEGSPGAVLIRKQMAKHLISAGWANDRGLALVFEPEVDVWLWTRTDHTARALGWPNWSALEAALDADARWSASEAKPRRPKELAEWALRHQRKARSSLVYRRVAENVGLGRCTDPAFQRLRDALQRWFPPRSS
ncbi:hypothetical protein L6V77_31640 [Myxococcota bacterium]|nr:hypothetical protein [Myxococcota bacterium]